jgi:hypothetical protein
MQKALKRFLHFTLYVIKTKFKIMDKKILLIFSFIGIFTCFLFLSGYTSKSNLNTDNFDFIVVGETYRMGPYRTSGTPYKILEKLKGGWVKVKVEITFGEDQISIVNLNTFNFIKKE